MDIEINGECVDLHMKLGDNGEAFFVEENENMEVRRPTFVAHRLPDIVCNPSFQTFSSFAQQSEVPAHLCTSPIPLEGPEEIEETAEGSLVAGSGTRRKKRRRKRIRSDTHLREEASSSSDEREREKEWERESDQAGQESPIKEQPITPLQLRSVI